MPSERCACGRALLHYSDPTTQALVEQLVQACGPTVTITTPRGAWRVPRHYIALHGLRAADLPQLAVEHGWEPVRYEEAM